MAKKKALSKHSRAARRATSPSIDTDKSLKDVQPPRTTPSVLGVHRSAGVSKKVRAGRKSQMSARARRRHEKGLEMAEAVSERTNTKLQRSLGKGRTVKERSKAWEQVNKAAEEEREAEAAEARADEAWETDDEGGAADVLDEATPLSAAVPVVEDDGDLVL